MIRLINIAKELNVGITSISEYLNTQLNINIDCNPNVKISREVYHLIKLGFISSFKENLTRKHFKEEILYLYTINWNFLFTDSEKEQHNKIVERYNNTLNQTQLLKKNEEPYSNLTKGEKKILLNNKIKFLKSIQLEFDKNRLSKTTDIKEDTINAISKYGCEIEKSDYLNAVDMDDELEEDLISHKESDGDPIDWEKIIMDSFRNGSQDKLGY